MKSLFAILQRLTQYGQQIKTTNNYLQPFLIKIEDHGKVLLIALGTECILSLEVYRY